MVKHIRKRKNELSEKEMSNSGSFKLLENENTALKKSLIGTQNELEIYRSKYHESDKKNGVYESMKTTVVFHEVIKFLGSVVFGGVGINLLTNKSYFYGFLSVLIGIIIYISVVRIDNKIFNKDII